MICPPFFPLFADEFLGSVHTLTNEQVGAFVRLAFCTWHHSVLDTNEHIRQIVGHTISEADLKPVLNRFYSIGGELKNKKIEDYRKRYAARSLAGTVGGAATARGRAIRDMRISSAGVSVAV